MKRRTEDVFRFLIRHRVSVLLVHGAVFVAALIGASEVQVDYSAEDFLISSGRDQEVFDAFKAHFPKEDLQVSAFLEVDGPLGIDDFRTLARLAAVFEDAGLDPVRWLGTSNFIEETLEDGQAVVRFVHLADEADLSEARLRDLVETRRDHPLFEGIVLNAELTVFAVHGYLDPSENTDARRRELVARLQAEVEDISDGARRIVLSGLPVLRVTIPLALETDMARLLGIAMLISFIALWLYFQRLSLALLCFAAVVPAIFLTLGMMGYVGQSISVLTSAVPIVILVVVVSDAIHLVMGSRRAWQGGLSVEDAVTHAFSSLARSCFFTSLTTALGFAGLVATRNRLVGEFGIVTGLALVVAYVVTLTLLPPLLSFAKDLGPEMTFAGRLNLGLLRRVETLLGMSPFWPNAVFALCLAVGLALGAGLRVQAFLIDDLKDGDEILEDLRWVENSGYGLFQVNVLLTAHSQPGHSAELLHWIEELQAFADAEGVVIGSVALPQFVDELGAAYGSTASGSSRNTEEVSELLFLSDLQGETALADVYLRDEGAGQVIIFVRDIGSSVLSPFLERLEKRLALQPPPDGSATVTGTVKQSHIFWDQLVSRFLPGVLFSVFLVWMALSWMFRSVRLGLLAVVPNLVPLAMLLGLMRLGGFDLKPSTIIVFAIGFGIVADDTIHFLGALAENLRSSLGVDSALASTVREVGPALVTVTVVVMAGFSVLMLSRFQVLFLIGFLTAVSALFALAADLIGFPALLRVVARRPAMRSLLERRSP